MKNPLEFVLSGLLPLKYLPGVYVDVQIKNRSALDQLRTGKASLGDIEMLILAFNLTEALALRGKGHDWLEEINQGQAALLALSRRGSVNKMQFTMTAAQWVALKLVMELHEEQLANATVQDIEKAHDFVMKAISLGKAQSVVQTTKEIT